MFRTPFKFLVLLLSICSITVAQAEVFDALAPRQSPSANAATSAICQNYARVANLSTVGLNSTYRAAFLRSSNLGTFDARAILDVESPKLMGMMMDVQLNQQCGNLSQIAIDGAAANLTQGTVLGLTIADAPGIAVDAAAMPIIQVVIFLVFCGTWISL
ncbi:hypothetical protein F4805DRAFT_412243 [Annulohypoxylon moriforme]|nr:hypothetical protein F4805DRAFT_412243 [Annulohypoxylon moriforme]